MNGIRRLTTLWILVLLLGSLLALPAAATVAEYQGLEVSIVMDKQTYDPGEAITATITVTNVSAETITIVNLEQLIPAGYKLTEGSDVAMKDVEMHPGRILVLQVTFQGDPNAPVEEQVEESGPMVFLNKLLYGETMGIPNMFLAVMLVIAIGIFLFLT